MKTKLLILVVLLSPFAFRLSPCYAQVPQGFNYQAIARDGSGIALANQALPVKIAIQTSLTGGTLIYEELFSSVTSNQFGLISLVVGTGTQTGGSAASFSAIDWKAPTLFLKTIIQYPGTTWTTMGTSQLWGVPYSLVAKEVAGPLAKLGISGTTDVMDEALFEVKNKAGNTVFAVYNEGIRAYVGNGKAKGIKGGFSVGGYDATKGSTIYDLFTLSTDSARLYFDSKPAGKGIKGGFSVGGYDMTKGGIPVQDYLTVNKDSVRIYIDSNPATKGIKGGFSVGGYDMTKGGAPVSSYLNVETNASGIINPSQNRILWYPLKNAFMTGRVRIGTPDSIGVNSFATGYESKSRGMYSQAMGFKAIANGDYSTAIGKNAVANSINSFAFGDSARATKSESYAIGRGADASGYRSFALGSAGIDQEGKVTDATSSKGDYSFALGQGSQALSTGSFAIGIADTAKGGFSFAFGYKTIARAYCSTAMGFNTIASQIFSTAMGYGSKAQGAYSTAMGEGSIASGQVSTAMGYSTASGQLSTSMGRGVASSLLSTAMGSWATASGYVSVAMGEHTVAPSFCETVIGAYNTSYTPASTNLWNTSDRLFVIGNGQSDAARSNALTVLKNGYVGIGTATPVSVLDVSGDIRSTNKIWADVSGASGSYFRGGNDAELWDVGIANTLAIYGVENSAVATLRLGSSSADISGSNGNIGIGTDTPSQKLDVKGGGRFSGVSIATSGSGLEIDFNAFADNRGRIFTYNRSTSTYYGLRIDGSDVLINTLTSGNVGIGTTAPGYRFQVNNSLADYVAYVNNTLGLNTSRGLKITSGSNSVTGSIFIGFHRPDDVSIGLITQNGAATTNYGTTSDARVKENITDTRYSISDLLKVKVHDFNFIYDPNKQLFTGFIAQELIDIFPNAVSKPENDADLWTLDYGKITPLLVKAIQDQQQEIESQKQENRQLKSDLQSLKEEIDQIKAMLAAGSSK
jgi:hypothetical protein